MKVRCLITPAGPVPLMPFQFERYDEMNDELLLDEAVQQNSVSTIDMIDPVLFQYLEQRNLVGEYSKRIKEDNHG